MAKNGEGIAKVVGKMDNIFKMCAMMHNMILDASTLRPGDSCATEALRTFFR